MRTFYLERDEDATGVSGTGRVAEGVLWEGGFCTIRWLEWPYAENSYPSIEGLEHVHGHRGQTRVVFEEVSVA